MKENMKLRSRDVRTPSSGGLEILRWNLKWNGALTQEPNTWKRPSDTRKNSLRTGKDPDLFGEVKTASYGDWPQRSWEGYQGPDQTNPLGQEFGVIFLIEMGSHRRAEHMRGMIHYAFFLGSHSCCMEVNFRGQEWKPVIADCSML